MTSLFTAADNASFLAATGFVTVVKGTETTQGHLKTTPVRVLEGEGGVGGVQTVDARVTIANGVLTGIDAEGKGTDATVEVDGVSYTIIGTGPADGEDDGDIIALMLRRD